MLTQQQVKENFDYHSDGYLIRITNTKNQVKINAKAGCLHSSGYIIIKLKNKPYKAHRLIWLWHHGEWPKQDIDHINMIRHDNRIENMREATRSQNCMNKTMYSSNKSGFKGVYQRGKKFGAEIMLNYERIKLGIFETAEEAHNAYCQAAKIYHKEFKQT